MFKFQRKEVKGTKTLGQRLKTVREETGINLDEAEKGTGIQKKYLQALEEGDYSLLPASVYIKNYLRVYAEFLQVSPQMVLDLYDQEKEIVEPIRSKKTEEQAKKEKIPKPIITPRRIRNLIIFLIIAACFVYLGVEIKKIVSPPILDITSPQDNLVIDKNSVEVSGKTEPESAVTINGQEVFLDPQGQFREKIELVSGLNTIEIASQKKHSKKSVIYRHILVEKKDNK